MFARTLQRGRLASVAALALPVIVPVAAAGPRCQDDVGDRLEELETEVAELRDRLEEEDSDLDFSSGPRLNLMGFSHVTFSADDVDSRGTGKDSRFLLGGVDMFITSQLGERISFLNETVFEPEAGGEYALDVERVVFKYELSDALSIHAGRFHTTIGYWNQTFHHGEWFQTSIGRPRVVAFEDDGGLLPVHMVGLALEGSRNLGAVDVDYAVEVGNGRGSNSDEVQIVEDGNDHKAVNLGLGLRPRGIPGLRFGGAYYVDRIPENLVALDGPLHTRLDEEIVSLYAVYGLDQWEVLAEYVTIDHEGGATDSSTDGYYLQVSRHMGEWTPYLRFDATEIDDGDAFYSNRDDRDAIALGTRWDFGQWSAIKFQYTRTDVDLLTGGTDDEQSFLVQLSFAF